MRIACTADWHIHEFQDFSKQLLVKWDEQTSRYVPNIYGKEMNSRLYHILDGICDIRDYCINNKIRHVLHAGDVFHKRGSISVSAFNAAYRVIQTFPSRGISLLILAGNHDQVDASNNPDTSIYTLQNSVQIVEEPLITTLSSKTESVSVLCMPYIRDKKYALEQFHKLLHNLGSTKQSILLMHCGVTGGAVGSGMHLLTDDWSMDDLRTDKWKYVVLGHYHRPQLLSHNTFYCGTPVQNSFNDELPTSENGGYNGFFVVDTAKRYDIQFVSVKQPRFVTVFSPEELEQQSSENYLRLKTTAEVAEQLSPQSNLRIELEKDYSIAARSEIGLGDPFETTIQKFFQENYKGNYPDALNLGLGLLAEARGGAS